MSETVFLQAWALVCGTITFVASLWFLHRYLERRHEGRAPLAIDGLRERLERIELAVEATAVEVERISEANRYVAKLMSERGGGAPSIARPERVITPH